MKRDILRKVSLVSKLDHRLLKKSLAPPSDCFIGNGETDERSYFTVIAFTKNVPLLVWCNSA